jgi:hypothetical protein
MGEVRSLELKLRLGERRVMKILGFQFPTPFQKLLCGMSWGKLRSSFEPVKFKPKCKTD